MFTLPRVACVTFLKNNVFLRFTYTARRAVNYLKMKINFLKFSEELGQPVSGSYYWSLIEHNSKFFSSSH
jgi:hypothetical protein